MWLQEETAILMAKERMADAIDQAERARVIRLSQRPNRSARVWLGSALVRLGCWLMGQNAREPGGPIEVGQSPC